MTATPAWAMMEGYGVDGLMPTCRAKMVEI